MNTSFLLYGANGYTGSHIARTSVQRGLHPILAGRHERAIAPLAEQLGMEYRIVDLSDSTALKKIIGEVPAVLHCAGPFIHTSKPMVEACLRTGTHYLDLTGEITVLETLHTRDAEAQRAGVMLLPGVGFDVVPTDCLAAHLKVRLPDACRLTLGIQGLNRLSHGTMATIVESMDKGGCVRKNGILTQVLSGWKSRRMNFGQGNVQTILIPWGDVSTAFYSTGIPSIETYAALPLFTRIVVRASRYFSWLLGSVSMRNMFMAYIRRQPPGPSSSELQNGKSAVWGQVENAAGQKATAILHCPDGYAVTIVTAIAAIKNVLNGHYKPGFQTPSLAFGKDFILGVEGVRREDML